MCVVWVRSPTLVGKMVLVARQRFGSRIADN